MTRCASGKREPVHKSGAYSFAAFFEFAFQLVPFVPDGSFLVILAYELVFHARPARAGKGHEVLCRDPFSVHIVDKDILPALGM